jgi:hypothetical protein
MCRDGTLPIVVAVLVAILVTVLISIRWTGVRVTLLTHGRSGVHLGGSGRLFNSTLRSEAVGGVAVVPASRRHARSLWGVSDAILRIIACAAVVTVHTGLSTWSRQCGVLTCKRGLWTYLVGYRRTVESLCLRQLPGRSEWCREGVPSDGG